jgi:hypothetical protein
MKWTKMVALTITLAGCAAAPVKPGAERVRLLQGQPAGCKYLGEVTGNQGNFLSGGFTSNADLETGARNDLKNKAMDLGGNAAVLLTSRAGVTGSVAGGAGNVEQTNVTLSASVYSCPASVLGD